MKTCEVCGLTSEDVATVCLSVVLWVYEDRCPKHIPDKPWLKEKRAQARGED